MTKKSNDFLDVVEKLDDEALAQIPDEDTKAVFLSEMTEDEFKTYQRKELQGWKHFDRFVSDLIHGKRSN